MSKSPLSVAIPENYGGRGLKVSECLRILSTASYESLALSLTFGINIALFLEPVAKYANASVKENIFNFFKDFNLTNKAYSYFKKDIEFSFTPELKQRKMIDLGKVFSRIISLNFVLEMEEKGFRKDLTSNCLEFLKLEVSL